MSVPAKFVQTIDGKAVDAPATFDVIDPSKGKAFAQSPDASKENINQAVDAAKRAFKTWSKSALADRKAALNKAADALEARLDDIATVLSMEQGKSIGNAKWEVGATAALFRRTAEFDIPVERKEAEKIEIRRKPLGVVAGITPWNFPPLMAGAKIAPAVITGNTIVLKPSPYTPLSTLLMGQVMNEAGAFPAGVVNIVGGGNEVGQTLVEHPDIAKVTFTGSIPTGKKIMETCARDLKRVTLELGGNDAAIIREDVDVEDVAPKVLQGAMVNTGQVCAAIKRVYVHESKYDAMCEAMAKAAGTLKFGNGLEEGTTHGPLNNKMQFDKVNELVEDAKQNGAKVLCGGAPSGEAGYFYPATVVSGIKEGVRLVDEEQFGPVVPVMSFKTDEEAIERANDTKYGLCGSVWSTDTSKGQELASQLECGVAWVNEHLALPPNCPFGGSKWSGIGREYGQEATLAHFTEPQVVKIA